MLQIPEVSQLKKDYLTEAGWVPERYGYCGTHRKAFPCLASDPDFPLVQVVVQSLYSANPNPLRILNFGTMKDVNGYCYALIILLL
jgi:hypothetical protein